MMLPDMLLPTYVQMLGALSAWLTKAEAQRPGGDGDALLAARLAPDMFPLATQVRFACRHARGRLSVTGARISSVASSSARRGPQWR